MAVHNRGLSHRRNWRSLLPHHARIPTQLAPALPPRTRPRRLPHRSRSRRRRGHRTRAPSRRIPQGPPRPETPPVNLCKHALPDPGQYRKLLPNARLVTQLLRNRFPPLNRPALYPRRRGLLRNHVLLRRPQHRLPTHPRLRRHLSGNVHNPHDNTQRRRTVLRNDDPPLRLRRPATAAIQDDKPPPRAARE